MTTDSSAAPRALKAGLRNNKDIIGLAFALFAGAFIWFCPFPLGLSAVGQHILATLAVWVILLVLEIMSPALITVLWLTFLVVFNLVKPEVAFGGFVMSTTWLLLGALMMAAGACKTGLAKRVACYIINFTGSKFTTLTLFLLLSGTALGAFVPSGAARLAIFLPIFLGIVEALKIEKGSNSGTNLAITLVWGAAVGGGSMMWLTGSLMNPIMTQALEQVGVHMGYFDYSKYMFLPGIVFVFICWWTLNIICPPEQKTVPDAKLIIKQELDKMGPISRDEIKAACFIVVAIVFWVFGDALNEATGLNFGNAWVAIICGSLMFFPKIGILKSSDLGTGISWPNIVFMSGTLGIGNIIAAGGVDNWAVSMLLDPILIPFASYGFIGFTIGMFITLFIIHKLVPSGSGTIALCAPLFIHWGLAHNINPALMGMMTLQGLRPYLFPYEHAPVLILWGYGYIKMGKFVKIMSFQCIFLLGWYILSSFFWQWLAVL